MLKHVAIVSFSFLSLVVGQCRFNQFSFGGSCYEISMTSSSWSDGEGQCQSLGGHLISIGSQFENTAVSGFIQQSGVSGSDVWIGATYDLANARWTWSDGNAFTFSSWSPGYPSNVTFYRCATLMLSNNQWMNADCNANKRLMCKIEQGVCDSGWTEYNNFCYKQFEGNYVSWNEAELYCATRQAHLASIHSEAENEFVFGLLRNMSKPYVNDLVEGYIGDYAWIGLTLNQVTRAFAWFDGTPVDYINFRLGVPESGDLSSCTYIIPNGHFYDWDVPKQWENDRCHTRNQQYVCKKMK